jgi:hypothetical protein
MSQRADFVAKARGEIGTIEGPKNNETKYGAFTGKNFLPWCGSFVMWCANQIGFKAMPDVVYTLLALPSSKGQALGLLPIAPNPNQVTLCFLISQVARR